jgi:hypothetical protein
MKKSPSQTNVTSPQKTGQNSPENETPNKKPKVPGLSSVDMGLDMQDQGGSFITQ